MQETKNNVVGLNKQTKFEYLNKLDCKKDTKSFWDK